MVSLIAQYGVVGRAKDRNLFLNEISIYFFVDYTIIMTEKEEEETKKQLESENEETTIIEAES